MEKFAKFLAETRGSKGVDEWDAMTFSHFQSYSHLASVERAAGDNTELEHATEYIEEIFEIWASGKFKGQFSQTEGLHKTPDPIPELFKLSDCQIDATIAIMGATGTGKSSFIKSITNDEEIVVGRSLEYIHHFRYFVPNTTTWINFIDAPGYDDSQGATDGLTQADILRNIASFLAAEYGQMRKLDGIIYMHRISDPRTVNSQRNLLMIKKLVCSAESMRNVVIITTMWDKLKSPQDGERLELELRTKDGFFKSLLDQGDQLVRLGHGVTGPKFPSTHQIVSDLIMHSQIGSMGNYGGR
ncbi:hypothetical protein JAAARDRAFT_45239 [Jaapia argillacea MUCL 33604]|uniref:G domain-containing protein n=1 Tax=Jaapia argillacea MUCL 33604 TaxID=933084 RepID=A0A067Q3Q7_9AGAM|nr:hypothetical protein JAAARDRAFT_45239 [Jaapia argillacea MUCL 33604]